MAVIPFKPRPKKTTKAGKPKALSSKGALDRLYRLGKGGPVVVKSYAGLATKVGWERKKTWTAVARWLEAGNVTVEKDGDELSSITVMPDAVRGKGVGVGKPARPQKPRRTAAKSVLKTVPESVLKSEDQGVLKARDEGVHTEDSGHVHTLQNTPLKSSTYTFSPHAASEAGTAPPVRTPETENTSDKPTPDAPPAAPKSEDHFMGFFSRKKPAEAPAEPTVEGTPPASGRAGPAYGGYGSPVAVSYGRAPALHPERPDWTVQPHAGGGGVSVPVDGYPAPVAGGDRPRIGWLTLLAALVMAGFSTILTVMGFAVLLSGLPMLSMGLGCATEFGRLVIVGVTKRRWHELNGLIIVGALAYIALAEGVSLIGVYSELHNLHMGNRPATAAAAEMGRAEAAAQVQYQQGVIADLDRQIASGDRDSSALIAADAKRGRIKDGRNIMATQTRQQTDLSEQRKAAASKLAGFQTDAARATGKAAMVDAEVGAVRQVAALLHIDAADALRWWLLAITVLIGPAASLLIAMAIPARYGRRAA